MSKPTSLFYFMYLILGVVLIWFTFAVIVLVKGNLGSLGQFGDSFGALNVLFGGLGFSALVYTILLQQEQLHEMQLQRMTMYKADLSFMGNVPVYANFKYVKKNQLIIFFSRSVVMDDDVDLDVNDYNVYLKLRNIGVGVAKEINYKWDFDIDRIILLTNNIKGFKVGRNGNFVNVENDSYKFNENHRFPNLVKENLFLLPYSNNSDNYIDIVIPNLYLLLLTVYMLNSSKEKFQEYIDNFPSLDLTMENIDTIGSKSSMNVKITCKNFISSSFWNEIPKEESSFFSYVLKVKETVKSN